MSGIRSLAALIVSTTLTTGVATFAVRALRAAEPAPVAATRPATDDSTDSSLGSLRFRLQSSRLAMRSDGAASVTSDPKPIRRPTAKLTVQSAGLMRIGRGDSAFVSVVRHGTAGGPSGYCQLQVPRGGADVGGPFILNAQNLYTPHAGVYALDVMSDGHRLRVCVSRQVQTQYGRMLQPVMTTVVRDLRQLARQNPQEVRVFVAPALLELTGIDCFPPEAGDVYRAFATLLPDPTITARLERLLPGLDASNFTRRSRASAELSELGGPGVLAALRTDHRALSLTQRAALEGYVAAHTLDPTRAPEEARQDAEFLIQCTAYPDVAVREAAGVALATLAGRELHPDAETSHEALRRDLLDIIYPGAHIDPDPPNPDVSIAYGVDGMDEAALRDQIRRMRMDEPRILEHYPKEKEYALRELMEVRRVKGLPVVRWGKKLKVMQTTRVGVKDAPGDWLIRRAGEFRKGSPEAMFVWSDARRDGDQGPWKIDVNFASSYLAISAQYGENATLTNVSMNIVNGGIMFFAGTRGRQVMQGQANSLSDLAKRQPLAVRKYVAPILHDLFGLYFAPPEPGLAYEVFDDIPADPKVARRLEELLTDFDSASSAIRDAAAKSLEELGLPGIIAAMRYDRTDLSFEQGARLSRFLASHGWRGGAGEAKRLRKDTSFLLACLEFEDVKVRRAAKAALEAEKGRAVELDVNLSPDDLSSAVDLLRVKLEGPSAEADDAAVPPATSPSTQRSR